MAGITAGKGYVDMSTVDKGEEIDFLSHMSSFVCTAIATSTKIGAAIVAKGGRFCEAPVSGSKVPAEKGVLLILAAGDQKLAEEAQPAFDQMGKKTWFLGELGQGARMKLVSFVNLDRVSSTFENLHFNTGHQHHNGDHVAHHVRGFGGGYCSRARW